MNNYSVFLNLEPEYNAIIFLPRGPVFSSNVTHDLSRFKSAEGLFNTELWGMDNPSLNKLVHKAVHSCPLDFRRSMWRYKEH